jgi:hypothetical protein
MSTVFLKNINPLGHVDLPLIGRQEDAGAPTLDEPGVGALVPGEVFEIDEELAGRAPWVETVVDDETGEETEVHHPGEGLLAQVGNYELVKPPKQARTKPSESTDTTPQEG